MILPGNEIAGVYSRSLVAISIVIAMVASYAALELGGRVNAAAGRVRLLWLTGGALAMGSGIWSMHYVGMLAFQLPVPVYYHIPTVLLSLVAAIFSSAVALFVAAGRKRPGSTFWLPVPSWVAGLRRCITSAWPPCDCRPCATTLLHW